jgi:hypothetical protein
MIPREKYLVVYYVPHNDFFLCMEEDLDREIHNLLFNEEVEASEIEIYPLTGEKLGVRSTGVVVFNKDTKEDVKTCGKR